MSFPRVALDSVSALPDYKSNEIPHETLSEAPEAWRS